MSKSTAEQNRDRKRGLPAVHVLREARQRNRFGRPSVNMVLFGVFSIATLLTAYWLYDRKVVAQKKSELLGEVRAGRATVGARWQPLREQLEGYAKELSTADYPGDRTDDGMVEFSQQFAEKPSLYVRMRLGEVLHSKDFAGDFEQAAQFSVRDGFTSCLYRAQPSETPLSHGVLSEQPWNLKRAYQAVRVLTDDWLAEAEAADTQLLVRVFEEQWRTAKGTDIPQVVDVVSKAVSYVVLFDEDVPALSSMSSVDGGAAGMPELQTIPHPVRILLVDLANKKVARRRLQVEAGYHITGENVPTTESPSLKRQVQNCQLAKSFSASLQPAPVAAPIAD